MHSLTSLNPVAALAQRLQRQWRMHKLKDPAYLFLFDAPPPHEWVSLDCETTGLNVRSERKYRCLPWGSNEGATSR